MLLQGGASLVDELAGAIINPLRNNFVERPWGGVRIREFKGLHPLPDQKAIAGLGLGEAFEIAAFAGDDEAGRHPSRVALPDGSRVTLSALFRANASAFLGDAFAARHGAEFPLLPKTLDIAELLSVQGHPPGNTEAYVICEAEAGATIRLGFSRDVEAEELRSLAVEGRTLQTRLIEITGGGDGGDLQAVVSRWLATRSTGIDALPQEGALAGRSRESAAVLSRLKDIYWRMLDAMNEIPVEAGQVIHNANPARIVDALGREPAAEVHALGNPDGHEIVALEIRRPGPTLRVWDNVRFPMREIDVESALSVLNLRATRPDEFIVERAAVSGRENVFVSVDSRYFRIEHLCPPRGGEACVPAGAPHCLHGLSGRVSLLSGDGETIGSVGRGESAFVPVGVGAYCARADAGPAEVLHVSVPL